MMTDKTGGMSMSVFEKHQTFIQLLQKDVVQKESSKRKKDEISEQDIQAELERKFDELFGPLDDDD